jgi:hypothetical protein
MMSPHGKKVEVSIGVYRVLSRLVDALAVKEIMWKPTNATAAMNGLMDHTSNWKVANEFVKTAIVHMS